MNSVVFLWYDSQKHMTPLLVKFLSFLGPVGKVDENQESGIERRSKGVRKGEGENSKSESWHISLEEALEAPRILMPS